MSLRHSPYLPGLVWEIDHDIFGWIARAYDGEYFIAMVTAKSKRGLKFKMWLANSKRNYEEVRYLW